MLLSIFKGTQFKLAKEPLPHGRDSNCARVAVLGDQNQFANEVLVTICPIVTGFPDSIAFHSHRCKNRWSFGVIFHALIRLSADSAASEAYKLQKQGPNLTISSEASAERNIGCSEINSLKRTMSRHIITMRSSQYCSANYNANLSMERIGAPLHFSFGHCFLPRIISSVNLPVNRFFTLNFL